MKKYLFAILLSILFLTGCTNGGMINYNNNDETTKIIESSGVTEDKNVGVFQFTNASLMWKDNKWSLEATVTNTSDIDQKLSYFVVDFYAEDVLVTSANSLSSPTIKAHEAISLHITSNEDLSTVTKINYKVER
nr:hypothetical protein [Bacilli bacterium]